MAKTTNYNLEKPANQSSGWGDDVNQNFDTIDNKLKENADGLAALEEDGSVGTDRIADGAVTIAKLDSGIEFGGRSSEVSFGKNLLNIAEVEVGKYIWGGAVLAGEGSVISGYCPVEPETEYTRTFFTGSIGAIFYNENKEIISFLNNFQRTFSTPANCCFVRYTIVFNQATKDYSQAQLELGSVETEFEPFYIKLSDFGYMYYNQRLNYPIVVLEGEESNSILSKETILSLIDTAFLPKIKETSIPDFPFVEPELYVASNNKFDKNTMILTGQYISDSIGFLQGSTGTYSRPIDVRGISELFYEIDVPSQYFVIHCYSNNIISSDSHLGTAVTKSVTEGRKATLPEGTNYVSILFSLQSLEIEQIFFKLNFGKHYTYDEYEAFYILDNEKLRYINTEEQSKKITITNSSKIGIFGNSYSQGYTLKGKHYISNLSLFSDYQFRNFGRSGDEILKIMQRLRDNIKWLGDIPVQDWNLTYGIIACRDNNSALYGSDIETYYEHAKKLSKEIETIGAIPILSTEHHILKNQLFNGFHRLSDEYGYMFMNWGTFAFNSMGGNYFQPMWYNNHPATRTQALWSENMRPWLDTLPRPKQSIKIFRKRSFIPVTNINEDLMYETKLQRAELFSELNVGHVCLNEESQKYFDRLNEKLEGYTTQKDEYQKIEYGTPVNVGTHSLISVILPCTKKGLKSLSFMIDSTNIEHVYIKKTLGLTEYLNPSSPVNSSDPNDPYYDIFEKPLGEWEEISIVDGVASVDEALFNEILDYDTVSFLLTGTSDIEIQDIKVLWTGNEDKILDTGKQYKIANGTELLTSNIFDSGWTAVGSPTVYVPVEDPLNPGTTEHLPTDITTVYEVTDTDYFEQAISDQPSNWRDLTFQVRVLCRNFPEYINSDDKYATSSIKEDSFDFGSLVVQLKRSSYDEIIVGKKPVGLYWHELIFEGILTSKDNNKLIIKSANSTPIQVAKVACKLY